MSFTLATIVRESAAETPDKPAVILDDIHVTYAQLDTASDRADWGARALGREPGQAGGVMLPNIPQFLVAYFGILKAGGVMVPMNVLLKGPEVAHYLRDSGATALVVWDGAAAEAAK